MSAIGPPVGALELVVTIVAAWVALGALGLVRPHSLRFVSRLIFPAGACVALLLTVIAFLSLDAPPQSLVMPLGLPDLPFHVRLDPLSAFFLLLIGAASFGVSLFSAGYFRTNEGTPPGLICFQYHVFLAAMASVVIADDAYAFMVAWEAMALASYFLVTTEHRIPEIRRAGFLYLLIAHIGAIAILLCFGVLQAGGGDYTFDTMRGNTLVGAWPTAAYFLALFGFGAKAGLLPLHVWLPEAHPADGRSLSRAEPRVLQDAALPRHGLGVACDERAQPRQARRTDSSHAVGGVARPRRHVGDCRVAAVERLCIGMAAVAGIPVHT